MSVGVLSVYGLLKKWEGQTWTSDIGGQISEMKQDSEIGFVTFIVLLYYNCFSIV